MEATTSTNEVLFFGDKEQRKLIREVVEDALRRSHAYPVGKEAAYVADLRQLLKCAQDDVQFAGIGTHYMPTSILHSWDEKTIEHCRVLLEEFADKAATTLSDAPTMRNEDISQDAQGIAKIVFDTCQPSRWISFESGGLGWCTLRQCMSAADMTFHPTATTEALRKIALGHVGCLILNKSVDICIRRNQTFQSLPETLQKQVRRMTCGLLQSAYLKTVLEHSK